MRLKALPQTAESNATLGAEPAHGPLAELATRQHGVVSIRQMTEELGYSRSAVARAAASSRLHRLHRGVFAVGHADLSHEGECLAAVLAYGSRALLSHHSAAWLWGIAPWSHSPISVTMPSPYGPKSPIRRHRSRTLSERDRAIRKDIPVTAIPRTLLDLAAVVRFKRLQRLLERAEELQLFDLTEVEELLQRAGKHPGVVRLKHALELYRPAPFTRSELERRFLQLAADNGLPHPVTGFNEAGYELDIYWPEHRFAVELDTYETHGSHAAFERDRVRQEDLKLVGVELTRVTGQRLDREPDRVLKRISQLLTQRRKQLDQALR